MPRDVSGNATPPSGSTAIPNTVISSTAENNLVTDIYTLLSATVSTAGVPPMAAPFKVADGTVTAPSVVFNSEAGTGIYHPSGSAIAFAVTGTEAARVTSTRNLLVGTQGDTGDRLVVAGTSRFTDNLVVAANGINLSSGNLVVTAGNLSVTGVTTLTGTLGVSAAFNAMATASITGNTVIGGTLGVTGPALFSTLGTTGNMAVSGTLTSGGTTVTTLNTSAAANFATTAVVQGAATLNSSLNVVGATYLATTLNVAGTTGLKALYATTGNFSSNVTASSFYGDVGGLTGTATINITGQSGYAPSAGNAATVNGQSFPYTNPTNTPNYVWASNNSNNNFLVNPLGMSVNYSDTSRYAANCGTASNSAAFGGQGTGYFVNNGGSAVVNIRNDGATGLRAGIGGYGDVVWNVYGSDERIKENIVPSVQDSLALINQIDFKSFQYKVLNPGTPEEWHIDDGHVHNHGVVAQQIQSLNPEWVLTTGTWLQPSVDTLLYSALKAITQLSIKLEDQVQQLTARIVGLENKG
jgi:hypothetical protein